MWPNALAHLGVLKAHLGAGKKNNMMTWVWSKTNWWVEQLGCETRWLDGHDDLDAKKLG